MKPDKRFEFLWIELKIQCGWEHMPKDMYDRIIPFIGIEEAKAMIRGLEAYTKNVMKRNYGDVLNERFRLGIAVTVILSQVEINISPCLFDMRQYVMLDHTKQI